MRYGESGIKRVESEIAGVTAGITDPGSGNTSLGLGSAFFKKRIRDHKLSHFWGQISEYKVQ